MKSFSPKSSGKARVVKEGTHTLYEPAVKGLGNAIMLRGIMSGEHPLSALFLQEGGELIPRVLPSTIRAQALDTDPMLSLHPSCESLVSSQGFVFGAQDADAGVAGVVISEGNIILPAPYARDGRGPPEVSVNLHTEGISRRGSAFLLDGFACELCILTRVAQEGGAIINKINSINEMVAK
jgi:hypothetical protein